MRGSQSFRRSSHNQKSISAELPCIVRVIRHDGTPCIRQLPTVFTPEPIKALANTSFVVANAAVRAVDMAYVAFLAALSAGWVELVLAEADLLVVPMVRVRAARTPIC
jgi:hypothetical protein